MGTESRDGYWARTSRRGGTSVLQAHNILYHCTVPPHRRLGVGGGGPSCLLIAGVRNHITAPRSLGSCGVRAAQCGAAMVQLAA
jgi:hypothetical protein